LNIARQLLGALLVQEQEFTTVNIIKSSLDIATQLL
jgi:hypothetical protein